MAPPPLFARTRGFTLLEVLIAVLVLSLGLLGLAALQSLGMRSNHSAYLRSQATVLAYDIIDRMRGNKAVADDAGTLGYDVWVANCPIPPPASLPDCATPVCELNSWRRSVRATLPCGDGAVTRTPMGCGPFPLPPCIVTVTVAWDDNRSGAANQQFAMSTQL